jgi:excisionase family DNA binding protein
VVRDRFYSTADLARVCGVSISTIKRWTDSGVLRCVRTPGGHRKFRAQDVAEAARRLGLGIADPEARPGARLDELALLLLQGNSAALLPQVAQYLRTGETNALRSLLLDLHRHGMRLADVSELLRGALRELVQRGRAGELDDFVLRRAEQMSAAAARSLLEHTPPPLPEAACALVACVPGVRDALASTLVLLVLGERGWRAVDLGADLTPAILRGGLASERPRLVVLVHANDGAADSLPALKDEAATQARDVVLLDTDSDELLRGLCDHMARQGITPSLA